VSDTLAFTIFKNKDAPLKLTLNDKQVEIKVNWNLTKPGRVAISIRAPKEIDILTPSTFYMFTQELDKLRKEIESSQNFINQQKDIFLGEFIELNAEIKRLKGE